VLESGHELEQRRFAMRRLGLAAAVAVALSTAGLLGALVHSQAARATMPGYKVVEISVENTNAAQLEKMLNEHSAGGWSLHSEIDERLFIFERR
jgi:hypothetical protein